MKSSKRLKEVLQAHRLKLTRNRLCVYLALSESSSPLTTSELIEILTPVDKVSVYRTIHLYEALGIVHRVWNGFKSKIELSDEFSPHHHHFSCNSCENVTSFKNDAIEDALHSVEHETGVRITNHVIELSGLCANCGRRSLQ